MLDFDAIRVTLTSRAKHGMFIRDADLGKVESPF
jgi:hypothetical protein